MKARPRRVTKINMKKKTLFQLSATALLFTCLAAHAESFQIKGLSLGSSSAVACGSAEVTDSFGELVKENKADAPPLIKMGTNECEVEFPSFGGNKLTTPAKLLFLNDALILIKIEIPSIPLSNFVDIYKSMIEDYGKSKRSISRPFVTDTWKQRGQTLILERLGRDWDDNGVAVILRQDSGYRIYEARSKENLIKLKKLANKKTKEDIR